MKDIVTVFVSSPVKGLEWDRNYIAKIFRELGHRAIVMEENKIQGLLSEREIEQAILENMNESTIVISIISGSSIKSTNYCQIEIDHAIKNNKYIVLLRKFSDISIPSIDFCKLKLYEDRIHDYRNKVSSVFNSKIANKIIHEAFLHGAKSDNNYYYASHISFEKHIKLKTKLKKMGIENNLLSIKNEILSELYSISSQIHLHQEKEMSNHADDNMNINHELDKLETNLNLNWCENPLLYKIAQRHLKSLYNFLNKLNNRDGYKISSIEEFTSLIDLLYSNDLVGIKAIEAIGYFEGDDNNLFLGRNIDAAKRISNVSHNAMERIFVSDDFVSFYLNKTFISNILNQIDNKINIRLISTSDYNKNCIENGSDFGIYTINSNNTGIESTHNYVLFGKKRDNNGFPYRSFYQSDADFKLISSDISKYTESYENVKRLSVKVEALIVNSPHDGAYSTDERQTSLTMLFGNDIIFRDFSKPTGRSIVNLEKSSPRKMDSQYAKNVELIIKSYAEISTVIYIGDTISNDAYLIENLRKLNINIQGFICNENCNSHYTTIGNTTYTKDWSHLGFFINNILSFKNCIFIFDLEGTTIAPRCQNHAYRKLEDIRIGALFDLARAYIKDSSYASSYDVTLSGAVQTIYTTINKICSTVTTKENEDYKAFLVISCLFGLLNCSETTNTDLDLSLYNEQKHDVTRGVVEDIFKIKSITENDMYKPSIVDLINQAIIKIHKINKSKASNDINNKRYVDYDKILDDMIDFQISITEKRHIGFSTFRELELNRTDEAMKSNNSITINKVIVDLINICKINNVEFFALTDRSRESTIGDGINILDNLLTVKGCAFIPFSIPTPK